MHISVSVHVNKQLLYKRTLTQLVNAVSGAFSNTHQIWTAVTTLSTNVRMLQLERLLHKPGVTDKTQLIQHTTTKNLQVS